MKGLIPGVDATRTSWTARSGLFVLPSVLLTAAGLNHKGERQQAGFLLASQLTALLPPGGSRNTNFSHCSLCCLELLESFHEGPALLQKHLAVRSSSSEASSASLRNSAGLSS